MKIQKKNDLVQKRRWRVRKKVIGTTERPRLSLHLSNKHIYAQAINDESGTTLAFASSLDKDLKGALPKGSDTAAAEAVGKLVAERAVKAGVKDVIFDRGSYIYHGRIKALADAAREAGLNF